MTEAKMEAVDRGMEFLGRAIGHLNDPVQTSWHADLYKQVLGFFEGEAKAFDRLEKRTAALDAHMVAIDTRLEKAGVPGVTLAKRSGPGFDEIAASFRDVAAAFRKRLDEPVPPPGMAYSGTPLHLLNRAVPRPEDEG